MSSADDSEKDRRFFSVVNYHDSGLERFRRETEAIREAIGWARETAQASLSVMNEAGTVLRTTVFSPRHPVEPDQLFVELAREASPKRK